MTTQKRNRPKSLRMVRKHHVDEAVRLRQDATLAGLSGNRAGAKILMRLAWEEFDRALKTYN